MTGQWYRRERTVEQQPNSYDNMKKILMMAAVMAVAIGANAQKKEYPKQEEMKPGM